MLKLFPTNLGKSSRNRVGGAGSSTTAGGKAEDGKSSLATTGQLISECICDVLNFSKKPWKNLTNFCTMIYIWLYGLFNVLKTL